MDVDLNGLDSHYIYISESTYSAIVHADGLMEALR